MKVHSSTQSFFSSPVQSQQDSDSDDTAQFLLPDDSDSDGQQPQTPSVTSSGIPSSISSGFWLSQSGATSTPATSPSSASTTNVDGSDSSSDTSSQDLLDEFANLASMTPAQKIRAQYLEEHNLTEDQFNALPSDQQKAINDQIADEIKQKLGVDGQDDKSDGDTDSAASALSIV